MTQARTCTQCGGRIGGGPVSEAVLMQWCMCGFMGFGQPTPHIEARERLADMRAVGVSVVYGVFVDVDPPQELAP